MNCSQVLVLLSTLLVSCAAIAHPGSGLEVDAEGNVYLSDIFRRTIWRIDAEGTRERFVDGCWSHGFLLDAQGRLVYEHEGDGQPAPCSLWAVEPDGSRSRLIAPTVDRDAFMSPPFALRPDGSVVFATTERGEGNRWYALIHERDDGRARRIAGALEGEMYRDGPADGATFRMILELHVGADGELLILDRDRVRILRPDGTVTTRGPVLIEEKPSDPPFRSGPLTTWNRLSGLAVDDEGNAFVGYGAGRRVIRVAFDGSTATAHKSERGWAPVGVAIGPSGSLYVSEVSDRGKRLRVWRLASGDAPQLIVTIQ